MRRVSSSFTLALAALAAPPLSGVANTQTSAQAPEVVAHTVDVSSRQATLGLELSDGRQLRISMARGFVRVNDREIGKTLAGSPLEVSWRALLDDAASLSTPELRTRFAAWSVAGLTGADVEIKRQIDQAIRNMPTAGRDALFQTRTRAFSAPESAAERIGDQIRDNVARAVAGAVEERVPGDFDVNISTASRGVGAVGNNLAGLLGMFVALSCIAFGLVSFAPRQFEAVSDTIRRSFIRSFFAGLFAQPLLVPVLGMMTVGLVLTVVGIIVAPVVIAAFVVAVAVGMVGGYVALARAFGEVLLRRRGADAGLPTGTAPYRASVVGLMGLLAIWAPFALLSWMPVVGWILLWCAVVFTWIMATAGFGATILSRAGIRQSFVRPELPGFSDEFSWTGEMAAHRAAMKELE